MDEITVRELLLEKDELEKNLAREIYRQINNFNMATGIKVKSVYCHFISSRTMGSTEEYQLTNVSTELNLIHDE